MLHCAVIQDSAAMRQSSASAESLSPPAGRSCGC